MNRVQIFFLLTLVCYGVRSEILNVKLDQSGTIYVLVNSTIQYLDTIVECSDGFKKQNLTVVLHQHQFYERVWTGTTGKEKLCIILETRHTKVNGISEIELHDTSPLVTRERNLPTIQDPVLESFTISPTTLNATFEPANATIVFKGSNWRLLSVSLIVLSPSTGNAGIIYANPVQMINETHMVCNFTWPVNSGAYVYTINGVQLTDIFFPFNKLYNFTELAALGIDPVNITTITETGDPVIQSITLLSSESIDLYQPQNITLLLNLTGTISGPDISTFFFQFYGAGMDVATKLMNASKSGTLYTVVVQMNPGIPFGSYRLSYMTAYFPSVGNYRQFNILFNVLLNVSSLYDTTPPQLYSLDIVDVVSGNVTVVFHAGDNVSGVSASIQSYLTGNNITTFVYTDCTQQNGTLFDGFFVCTLSVASWNTNSDFHFKTVVIIDNLGNTLEANCSDPLSGCFNKSITVSTPTDTDPPVLHGFRLFSHSFMAFVFFILCCFNKIKGNSFMDLDISDDQSGIVEIRTITTDVSPESTPALVAGEYLNGTFRQPFAKSRLGSVPVTWFLAIILRDNAGNEAVYPIQDGYVYNRKTTNCIPDMFEYNDFVTHATPVDVSSSFDLSMCEDEYDYFSILKKQDTLVTVFVHSVDVVNLKVTLRSATDTVLQAGEVKTLEDVALSFTAKANTTVYVAIASNFYIEYNIQIGYNCTLTLEQCYPYRVDAENCQCSNNKTEQPLLTTGNSDDEQASNPDKKASNTAVIIGSVMGSVAFVLIAAAILLFIILRKRNKHTNNNNSIELSHKSSFQEKGEIEDIVVKQPIGGGNFSEVFYGVMLGTTPVALKKLKDPGAFDEFANESAMMKALDHKNVVHYFGTFISEGNKYLVTEYLSLGSLSTLIREKWSELTTNDLLDMAIDAAEGMVYLVSQKIVHRDLALRNLLVADSLTSNKKYIVKISDLGLSKALEKTSYYKSSTDKSMPVRWLSPEQLQYGKSSHQSDVYTFGVMLWELFSGGRIPYEGFTNAEASERILSGTHLPRLENCEVNEIMQECWNADPRSRPSFDEILQKLRDKKL